LFLLNNPIARLNATPHLTGTSKFPNVNRRCNPDMGTDSNRYPSFFASRSSMLPGAPM
jgi:hypothetical protein